MNVLLPLFFLVFPLAEVVLFGRIVSRIGFWDTLAFLVFSAIFGIYLLRIQGQATLIRVQQALSQGHVPTGEMLDGLMIFLAGIFFIVPGFLSDVLGLCLLFPPTRWYAKWIFLKKFAYSAQFHDQQGDSQRGKRSRGFDAHKGEAEDAEIVE